MNKDKIIKDLKERNDKLKNQYELLEIRTNHLEHQIENQKEIIKKQTEKIIPENHKLYNTISKAITEVKELYEMAKEQDNDNVNLIDRLELILKILGGEGNER